MNRAVARWPLLLLAALFLAAVSTVASARDCAVTVQGTDLLRDPQGTLGIDNVSSEDRAAGFRDLHASFGRSSAYTSDVLWLRIVLRNDSGSSCRTLLQAGVPRLASVRLYDPAGDRWRIVASGVEVPVAARRPSSRQPVFELAFDAGERRTVYVRISSPNAIALPVATWSPADFVANERRIDLVNGMQFGAIFLLAVFGLLLFAGTRDRLFLWFTATMLFVGLYDFSIHQYGLQYLWPVAVDWDLRSPGFFLALTVCAGCLLVTRLLNGDSRMPNWSRVLRTIAVASALLAVPVLVFDYRVVIGFINVCTLAFATLGLAAMIVATWRRYPGASALLAAFLLAWLVALLRLGQIMGLLPADWIADYAHCWVFLVSGVLVVMAVARRVQEIDRERARVADELLATQRSAREDLEREVSNRTRDLSEAAQKAAVAEAARTRFLGQISHELRTPLHGVLGNLGLLLEEPRSEDERRRLASAHRSSRQLLSIIDELLEFVRGESQPRELSPAPVRLAELLQGVVDDLAPLARRHDVRLQLGMATGLPEIVEVDGGRLRQVLGNLLANACRHSGGSAARLDVRAEPLGPERFRLGFTVRDNGRGIPAVDRERMFAPFARGIDADPSSGLGLGLNIARDWVRRMGGELQLDADASGGCVFRFELELPAPGAQAGTTGAGGAREASGQWRALTSVAEPRARPPIRPSDEALAWLRIAVGLGLVTDIEEWADQVSVTEPDAMAFVSAVREALGRVDMEAIRRLAES